MHRGILVALVLASCGDGTQANPNADGGNVQPEGGPANGKSPNVAGCDIFPSDNPWNRDVSGDPLSADSAMYLAKMATGTKVHPDWGTFAQWYGIPINTGTGAPPVKIDWSASYGPTESDKLPCAGGAGDFCYPIPSTVKIEGGPAAATTDDRHVLYIDTGSCTLYELYNAQNWVGPDWTASNGAIWHLNSDALRPEGWTSADAAGLPIMPGLVRYDEVKAGEIRHATRFTMNNTQQAWIHPATHAAGKTDTSLPPMGLRLRLKASFAVSKASAEGTVIVTALKKYGVILADNGSDWYIGGDTSDGWGTDVGGGNTVMDGIISTLNQIHGSDFEVVDTGPIAGH